ncbi:MAG: alpha/beta fold hydrolase [Flavobacteriales bacterium]|nr:alpha/beta fold hydrolase [Flavobacteriales bacterium]
MSALHIFVQNGFTLAFRTYGRGPRSAIAFHGFGGTGRNFEPLAPSLSDRFTTYAIDIFFHGESRFPAGRTADEPITPEEFTDLLRSFMDANGIGKAVMMGFSLGGRLALTCIERLPERWPASALFAPDGLVRFPWYRAASKWGWGRSIYRRFVQDPSRVHWLMDTARGLRLVTDRYHKFLKGHTSDTVRRQLVYDVWLSLRLLEPDLARVGAHLKKYDLRAEVFLGLRDKVILPQWGRNLKRHAPERVHLHMLETGHQVVTPDLGMRLTCLS